MLFELLRIAVNSCRLKSADGHRGVMSTLLAIVVLGLFLGMRHATDPDHVVAITTIVSRERTMLHAAIIGALWGLGHTVTILVVGSAIILFKLTIPPTLGLTMELSVACMLILLGAMNLTGLHAPKPWNGLRPKGMVSGAHAHVDSGTRDRSHAQRQPQICHSGGRAGLFDWAPQ